MLIISKLFAHMQPMKTEINHVFLTTLPIKIRAMAVTINFKQVVQIVQIRTCTPFAVNFNRPCTFTLEH